MARGATERRFVSTIFVLISEKARFKGRFFSMKMVNNNDTHRCEEWSHNLILR
jgi:hypothetical protein